MDGGRVLRALLAMRMEYARATRVAATVGQGMALLFGFLGLFGNPMLLVIAFFVWIGAAQESGMVQMRSALDGVRVRQSMITDFRVLSPGDTLGHAAELVLAGSQADFPVLEEGRLVGILSRNLLLAGLSRQGGGGRVGEAMTRDFVSAAPDDLLEATIGRQSGQEVDLLPVLDEGRLVGFLTRENVGEYLLLQSALRPPPLPGRSA
jgi:CBS domain-containing protein